MNVGFSDADLQGLMTSIRLFRVSELKELARSLLLSPSLRKKELQDSIIARLSDLYQSKSYWGLMAMQILVSSLYVRTDIPAFQTVVRGLMDGRINYTQEIANLTNITSLTPNRTAPRSRPTPPPQHLQLEAPHVNFKPSIFYKILSFLNLAPQICRGLGLTIISKHTFTLVLSSVQTKLLQKDPANRLYVLSGKQDASGNPQKEIEVSYSPEGGMYINLKKMNLQAVKGLKDVPGSSRPLDITEFVRHGGLNKFEWFIKDEASYVLSIGIAKQYDPEYVYKSRKFPSISKEEELQRIKSLFRQESDDDIVIDSIQVSLRCPYTYVRLKEPARGRNCNHLESFDLFSFIAMQHQMPTWKCPICHSSISIDSLVISSYMTEALQKSSPDVEAILVLEDGSWSEVHEGTPAKGPEHKSPTQAQAKAPKAFEPPSDAIVISLDSDSEDEAEAPINEPVNEPQPPSDHEALPNTEQAPQEFHTPRRTSEQLPPLPPPPFPPPPPPPPPPPLPSNSDVSNNNAAHMPNIFDDTPDAEPSPMSEDDFPVIISGTVENEDFTDNRDTANTETAVEADVPMADTSVADAGSDQVSPVDTSVIPAAAEVTENTPEVRLEHEEANGNSQDSPGDVYQRTSLPPLPPPSAPPPPTPPPIPPIPPPPSTDSPTYQPESTDDREVGAVPPRAPYIATIESNSQDRPSTNPPATLFEQVLSSQRLDTWNRPQRIAHIQASMGNAGPTGGRPLSVPGNTSVIPQERPVSFSMPPYPTRAMHGYGSLANVAEQQSYRARQQSLPIQHNTGYHPTGGDAYRTEIGWDRNHMSYRIQDIYAEPRTSSHGSSPVVYDIPPLPTPTPPPLQFQNVSVSVANGQPVEPSKGDGQQEPEREQESHSVGPPASVPSTQPADAMTPTTFENRQPNSQEIDTSTNTTKAKRTVRFSLPSISPEQHTSNTSDPLYVPSQPLTSPVPEIPDRPPSSLQISEIIHAETQDSEPQAESPPVHSPADLDTPLATYTSQLQNMHSGVNEAAGPAGDQQVESAATSSTDRTQNANGHEQGDVEHRQVEQKRVEHRQEEHRQEEHRQVAPATTSETSSTPVSKPTRAVTVYSPQVVEDTSSPMEQEEPQPAATENRSDTHGGSHAPTQEIASRGEAHNHNGVATASMGPSLATNKPAEALTDKEMNTNKATTSSIVKSSRSFNLNLNLADLDDTDFGRPVDLLKSGYTSGDSSGLDDDEDDEDDENIRGTENMVPKRAPYAYHVQRLSQQIKSYTGRSKALFRKPDSDSIHRYRLDSELRLADSPGNNSIAHDSGVPNTTEEVSIIQSTPDAPPRGHRHNEEEEPENTPSRKKHKVRGLLGIELSSSNDFDLPY